MAKIAYNDMLLQLMDGGPHRITYVVGRGKEAGARRDYVLYYGAPNPGGGSSVQSPTSSLPSSKGSRKKRKTHLRSGNLPFTEFGSRRLLTLFSFNIIKFNGKTVYC